MGCLLPVCFFQIRRKLSHYQFLDCQQLQWNTKAEHWILVKPTKLSQLFLVKMFPQLKFHSRIQGQRFFFHFNPLATQSKPCQRGHAAVSVPNESLKRWKRSSSTHNSTRWLFSFHLVMSINFVCGLVTSLCLSLFGNVIILLAFPHRKLGAPMRKTSENQYWFEVNSVGDQSRKPTLHAT